MATLYYKTLKTSPTGEKIQSLVERGEAVTNQIYEFMIDIGAGKEYMMKGRSVFGTGVCGVLFYERPDMKIWKNFIGYENYYRPRLSSKLGKEMDEKLESFEVIERDEIGNTFGFDRFGSNPGYQNRNESDYFGIAMDANWSFKMPEEFTEITYSEYSNL